MILSRDDRRLSLQRQVNEARSAGEKNVTLAVDDVLALLDDRSAAKVDTYRAELGRDILSDELDLALKRIESLKASVEDADAFIEKQSGKIYALTAGNPHVCRAQVEHSREFLTYKNAYDRVEELYNEWNEDGLEPRLGSLHYALYGRLLPTDE